MERFLLLGKLEVLLILFLMLKIIQTRNYLMGTRKLVLNFSFVTTKHSEQVNFEQSKLHLN